MPRSRDLVINLGLLFGTLILLIGGAEIALRATGIEKGHVSPPPLYQKNPDPDISYELKPNMKERAFRSTVTTNSLGFRSPEPDPAKPTIAVLGDSITFGYGVEDDQSLPAQMQTQLPQFNVQNTGVPGYTILQERVTYEKKVHPLDPSALVLVFYWNDLADFVPGDLSADGNLYPRGQVPSAPTCSPIREGLMGLIPGKCWLDTHSAVYRVLKKIVLQRAMQRDLAEQQETYANDPGYEYLTDDNLQKYVTEFGKLASASPQDMLKLFVIWPDKTLHVAMRPNLKKIAEDQGFKVLDLYDTFGNTAETLSWDTVHPSAGTLERAAKKVADVLKEKLPQ